jgi:hypothetical protein
MDWKSTAAISGAGLLATWFFSMPAVQPPATNTIAPAAGAPQSSATTIDIQREAARLQLRTRNLVTRTSRQRFTGARPAQKARSSGTSGPPRRPAGPDTMPPPPRLLLDGIATDLVDGQEQRTAILNTDSGVVLAKEGEQVAGQFRIVKIAADAVELVNVNDGSVVRIVLR